ncbi:hypothetical protein K501DRAFT_306563 [Backusella circina FSU 941]|nr:hypothetical protein K501DRAFT_306563 [Backusella circina FSU 941]
MAGSTQETKVIQKAVRASLNSMMYANSPAYFDLAYTCFEKQFKEYKSFVDYFESTWHHGYLFCCSCSVVKFCKHISPIRRTNGLPFTLRAIPTSSTINTNQLLSEPPLITSPDTTDESPSYLSTRRS